MVHGPSYWDMSLLNFWMPTNKYMIYLLGFTNILYYKQGFVIFPE